VQLAHGGWRRKGTPTKPAKSAELTLVISGVRYCNQISLSHELTFKTETESQTSRRNLWLSGEAWGQGIVREFGIGMCMCACSIISVVSDSWQPCGLYSPPGPLSMGMRLHTPIFKMGNQHWPSYSTGNSPQCYMAAWMKGGFGREWMQVYVCLSPCTVHLKLSQHCLLISYTPIQHKQLKKKSVLPMFSSRSFMMSSLTFRSLIHFWVWYSNFILLHVAI